ncbi:MAG: NAD(P)-dependent oxidoreductase, partial [Dehalococcoidia bacterium]|nr:NAD(P)-dependent oxidoreductase [Dehalococcoidia bacterium]
MSGKVQQITVGFVGLGQMGKPMAKNLVSKGFRVTVSGHIRKEPVEELRTLGATVADSPKELAEGSDVIVVMVRDTAQTEEAVRGKGRYWQGKGIWQGIKKGATLIICSTVESAYCQQLAEEALGKGVAILDAPISGGPPGAKSGTLTFMVGGRKEVFERCEPIFRAMGSRIFYVGDSGMGQVVKAVNNYMAIANCFAASEAINLGLKAGLRLDSILEVTRNSSGSSWIVDKWDQFMLLKGDYERRGESGTIGLFA